MATEEFLQIDKSHCAGKKEKFFEILKRLFLENGYEVSDKGYIITISERDEPSKEERIITEDKKDEVTDIKEKPKEVTSTYSETASTIGTDTEYGNTTSTTSDSSDYKTPESTDTSQPISDKALEEFNNKEEETPDAETHTADSVKREEKKEEGVKKEIKDDLGHKVEEKQTNIIIDMLKENNGVMKRSELISKAVEKDDVVLNVSGIVNLFNDLIKNDKITIEGNDVLLKKEVSLNGGKGKDS